MSTTQLVRKIESLPENLRKEASDFVDFLISKYKNDSQNTVKPVRKAGLAKGMIDMKEDFDTPLEDFNEYM